MDVIFLTEMLTNFKIFIIKLNLNQKKKYSYHELISIKHDVLQNGRNTLKI